MITTRNSKKKKKFYLEDLIPALQNLKNPEASRGKDPWAPIRASP